MLIHEGVFEMSNIKINVHYDMMEVLDGLSPEEAFNRTREIITTFEKTVMKKFKVSGYRFDVDYDTCHCGQGSRTLDLIAFREQTEEELEQIKQAEKDLKKKAEAHKLELYNQLKKELGL